MRNFFTVLLSTFYFLLSTNLVLAQSSMDSPNYKIRLGNFNMTSGSKSSTSYNLSDTVGQIAADFFSSTGYHVKAGFQYLYTLYDFSFTISSLSLDLGGLSSNTFSSATHTLTVTAPGQGYNVSVIETQKLTNATGDTIPNTTCDSGTCTKTSASTWTTSTNNGFGFNLTGNDISSDFISSSHFRPFPDLSIGDTPEIIMTSAAAGKNRVATVKYQVSPSATQAEGIYTTQIIYVATPVF